MLYKIFFLTLFSITALAESNCLVPASFSKAFPKDFGGGSLLVFDTEIAKWTEGLPEIFTNDQRDLLRKTGDTFAWTKVDLDTDSVEELLVTSSLLQGNGGYFNHIELKIYCNEKTGLTLCSIIGFGSYPYFIDPRTEKPYKTIGPKEFSKNPVSYPVRVAITNKVSKMSIGIMHISNLSTKQRCDTDYYSWSSKGPTMIMIQQDRELK